MIDIESLDEKVLVKIEANRSDTVKDLAAEIEKDFKRNFAIWNNKPEWLGRVPEGGSKVRVNRVFLATESVINNLTARPAKPNAIPANGSDEANKIAASVQRFFPEWYRENNVKEELRTGLRHLFFSKIIVLKMCWDRTIDDFTVKAVKPTKVKFGKTSTKEIESEFTIEEIDDKRLLDMLEEFPEAEEKVLKQLGMTKERAMIENPAEKWKEIWIGNGVAWIWNGIVLKKKRNPYWDWNGLKVTPLEKKRLTENNAEGMFNGRQRRPLMQKIVAKQDERIAQEKEGGQKFESYLSNYFDRPRKPYIFSAVLRVESKPTGDSTLIDQVNPLQEGIDETKRQIADNRKIVNGVTKVDTKMTTMTLADARRAHYETGGLVYGPGVRDGVTRETGKELPGFVVNDMEHSIVQLDAIFGTSDSFRGEGSKNETATGRAILREQNVSRLDELISTVEFVMGEVYRWGLQFIRTRYTEAHLIKPLGAEKAQEAIEMLRDDVQDGVEIKVIPGQILPEDRIFKAERAGEDYRAGVLDPVSYFEASGYDNPMEIAKRVTMFKMNPLSVVDMTPDDIAKLEKANATLAALQAPVAGPEGAEDDGSEVDLAQEQQIQKKILAYAKSPEFQALPNDQKMEKIAQIRASLQQSSDRPKVEVQ